LNTSKGEQAVELEVRAHTLEAGELVVHRSACIAIRLLPVRAESPTSDGVPDGASPAPIERRAQ
jgi:hypothetical protein